MRCSTVRQKLEAFAAEEFSPRASSKIEGHLRSCSSCREALARQKSMLATMRSVPAPPLPDGFADRVMAEAVRRGKRPPVRLRQPWNMFGWRDSQRLRQGVGVAAALAAGLLIGAFMGIHTWSGLAERPETDILVAESDPVAASGLRFLVGPGDASLGEAYLGMTRLSVDRRN